MQNWQRALKEPTFKEKLLLREQVIDTIRSFFKSYGFHEVETPLLVEHTDPETSISPFSSDLTQGEKTYSGFLTTSPEFAMKKLLAAGFGNIFQICKSFRNGEPISSHHNPEFTILEWYRVDADYTNIMDDCEQLLHSIAQSLGREALSYQGIKYDLSKPWERLSVAEAFQKYAGIDERTLLAPIAFLSAAKEKGYVVTSENTFQELFDQVFANEIERHLGVDRPTILYDYLASQAALARKKPSDPRYAERFEFYIAGIELGNAFSELADWEEQEVRLVAQNVERERLGLPIVGVDQVFIEAIKSGIPQTGGIAVGIDRLIMLFADVTSISDVLLFPAQDVFSLEEA